MARASGRDISEIFGYAPDDTTQKARRLWATSTCPFTATPCIKYNHDKTLCYGTCSVLSPGNAKRPVEEVIICPRRLYAENYKPIREVANDAFPDVPLYFFDEYRARKKKKELPDQYVVAIGQGSGREIQFGGKGGKLSMDWVLALVKNGCLTDYAGIEAQSIDITGNYRKNWKAYSELPKKRSQVPESEHGLNYANVHKRLIPQIIRKGKVLGRSSRFSRGLYFVLPEIVFQKFEYIIGNTKPIDRVQTRILSVFTYSLGPNKGHGNIRDLIRIRIHRVNLDEFALNFIAGDINVDENEIDTRIENALNNCD